MTVKDLYCYAVAHKMEEAVIRVSDGMAVSFYPNADSIGIAPFEVVIDVSGLEAVEFDDLTPSSQRVAYHNEWYFQG